MFLSKLYKDVLYAAKLINNPNEFKALLKDINGDIVKYIENN